MSVPSSSVAQARRDLGQRLRELRQDAGYTQAGLAGLCGWERTKVTKLESGTQTPYPADIRAWCEQCGAIDQIPDLVASSRQIESAYVEWKRLERGGLRRLQEDAVPLLERTAHHRVYQPSVIPGLLQTPGYATALLSAITTFRGLRDDVEDAVAVRIARQMILRRKGYRFAFLIEEDVLRSGVGGSEVMADQLRHLLDVMTYPAVALGVIRFSPGRRMWPVEGFNLFDDARAEVETLSADITVTRPSEVAVYVKAFGELAAMAIYGEQARALIEDAIDALNS